MTGKRRLSKRDREKLTIAVIIISVIIIGICVFGDFVNLFGSLFSNTKKDVIDPMTSNAGDLINATGDVLGGTGGGAGNLEDILERLEEDDLEGFESAIAEFDAVGMVRVVDGDTYILDIDGEETRVRLIGVDTPESVAPSSYYKENTDEGKRVSEIVKERMSTVTTLYIEYDVSRTDKYGRTLAYLYFPDGTMVQDWLLESGLANVATYPPNVKYKEHFESVEGSRNKEAA